MPLSNHMIVLLLCLSLCVIIPDCNRKVSTISDTGAIPSSQGKMKVEFGPLYFDNYRSVLKPEALSVLYKVGAFLFSNPDYRLIIKSYSDDRCSRPYAKWLSDERAKEVHDWLVLHSPFQIDEKRVTVKSFGDTQPLNDACGEDTACHSKNRRIELTAVKP